jgi:hypothetical protein
MTISIDIDRLSISLYGVSAGVAEAAVAGLDDELRRRLGNLVPRALVNGDLGVLRLETIAGAASSDPAALRNLIADRLVTALMQNEGEA